MYLSLSNVVDLLPSNNRRIRMKIWLENRGTCNWFYLYLLTAWTALSLNEIRTLLQIFCVWTRVTRSSKGWMDMCRDLEGVGNYPLQLVNIGPFLLFCSFFISIRTCIVSMLCNKGIKPSWGCTIFLFISTKTNELFKNNWQHLVSWCSV